MSLYTLCPPPPHPLPETFLLFMIGPDDMFLEIFFFFFGHCISPPLLRPGHRLFLVSITYWDLSISVRLFATLFKWFLHLCICVLLEGKARASHRLCIDQMLSQGLMKKQIELEWLLLCVSHYMPGTPLRTLNV